MFGINLTKVYIIFKETLFAVFVLNYGIAFLKETFFVILTFREAYVNTKAARIRRYQSAYQTHQEVENTQSDEICTLPKKKKK